MVRDLYMFSRVDTEADVIWFRITYENTLHSEADITSFFAEKELDIRFAYLDSSEDPSRGRYVMFTEAKKDMDIESIANELERMDVVLDIEWGVSKNRVIQSVDFPLHIIGDRAVLIRAKTFVNFLNVLNEHVPQSEGLLTIVGLRNGEGAARYLKEVADMDDSNFMDLLGELLVAAGWGVLEHDMDITELKGTARMIDSFIAGEYEDSDVPVCGYISGFIAGYISESLGKVVQVRETRCKAMGDTLCEHIISPVPEDVKIEHLLRGR
ncbi:V4R domain-containing protein [Methanolobus sp. WCC4]|uniref:V4R domain-containing protein n=1 Tax=Methanolobus sp. WCC4 TaxID=3125784 RepID=UPI0030FB788A